MGGLSQTHLPIRREKACLFQDSAGAIPPRGSFNLQFFTHLYTNGKLKPPTLHWVQSAKSIDGFVIRIL